MMVVWFSVPPTPLDLGDAEPEDLGRTRKIVDLLGDAVSLLSGKHDGRADVRSDSDEKHFFPFLSL